MKILAKLGLVIAFFLLFIQLLGDDLSDKQTQMIIFPGNVGDKYYEDVVKKLNRRHPKVILIGNSMLGEAVDQNELSSMLDVSVASLWVGGMGSAWWFLVVKNVIPRLQNKPELIAVFFRDDYLTLPGLRVTGNHKRFIDDYLVGDEDILHKFAYGQESSLLIQFISSQFQNFSSREQYREKIDKLVKDVSGFLCGVETVEETNAFIANIFSEEKMNGHLLHLRQIKDEERHDSQRAKFLFRPEDSFLQPMIVNAKEQNVQLLFVRVKRRRDLLADKQPRELLLYQEKLRHYLRENDVLLLDFTDNNTIQEKHFGRGDHLSRQAGRSLFTDGFAGNLRQILNSKVTH